MTYSGTRDKVGSLLPRAGGGASFGGKWGVTVKGVPFWGREDVLKQMMVTVV